MSKPFVFIKAAYICHLFLMYVLFCSCRGFTFAHATVKAICMKEVAISFVMLHGGLWLSFPIVALFIAPFPYISIRHMSKYAVRGLAVAPDLQ